MHYFVGGATKLYGAALYRLREEDFGELRHHDGVSPAWPIGYDEMEPYYTQAEQLYQVHGARGEDPTEPPASAPYPFPAVSHEPRIQQLSDDLAAAGHHPFHAPCGVMLNEANMPYSNCVRCADLRRLPVPGARQVRRRGAGRAARARAPERHAADERAGAGAPDQPGRHGRDGGRGRTRRASARRTRPTSWWSRAAPRTRPSCCSPRPTTSTRTGLANGSDQLGRNYTFHNSQAVLALSKEENPTVFQKTLGLNDFYFGSDDFEFPLGNIQMVGKSSGRHVPRREAARDQARAAAHAGEHGPPRGRLLALDRGPAAAGEPRHARPRRERAAQLHRRPTRSPRSGSTTS